MSIIRQNNHSRTLGDDVKKITSCAMFIVNESSSSTTGHCVLDHANIMFGLENSIPLVATVTNDCHFGRYNLNVDIISR